MNMKKIRILIYSDHFFPSIGGSENYALDLANELYREGHKVGVITAEQYDKNDEFEFEIFRLHKPFSVKRVNVNFIEVLNIIKMFRPDVFHINYQTGGENILIPLLKLMKIPIFITYHADHISTLGKIIDELQLATTFRFANIIIVQSERDKKKFMSRGISDKRLKLFPFNGIDTEKYKCNSKPILDKKLLHIICIARLDDSHKYKGIQKLIDNIKNIKGKDIGFNFFINIIGNGNMKNFYENECIINHISNVNFLGDLKFNDLVNQICRSNFLILPSIDKAEGFGRVALEAISCGIPVIVSKYAGIAELIQKYDAGVVYDPEKFDELINIIKNLLSNPQKIDEYINNGYRLISECGLSLKETTHKTVELYYSIIEKYNTM